MKDTQINGKKLSRKYFGLSSKKSQIIGQIFVYILVVMVVGGIILVGFWAVKSLLKKSCEVSQINFKMDMEKMLARSDTFGSTSKTSLPAPCGYNKICLADVSQIGKSGFTCAKNRIVEQSIKDNQSMNIFLVNEKGTYPAGYSGELSLATPAECLCFDSTNSRFYFKLKGLGLTTEVSKET